MKSIRLIALLALVGCSHDAKRENPLDPELTPAVGLVAAVDDSAGTVALSWDQYRGRTEFGAYLVLRNQVERTAIDTLSQIMSVSQTTFEDTSALPNTAYEYRVSVRTAAGLEVPSASVTVSGYPIQPVLLLQPDTDARNVEIRLRWRRFPGARFQAYRIERREVGQQDDFSTIHRVESLGDTAFVDATVQPDARYVYRVVLEAAGQDWVSNRTGREGLLLSEVLILRAVADSSTGIVNLSWSPYEGGGFEGYRVLRADPNAVDATIFETADRADTTFADSTALSGVDYAYRVAVMTGEGELVSIAVAGRLELPWVALPLQAVEFTSLTASAALTWSPYAGPRFQAYHVERRPWSWLPGSLPVSRMWR